MIVVWSLYPGNLPSKLMVAIDSAITLANIICSKDYQWFTSTTILITRITVPVINNIITSSMVNFSLVNCSLISLPSFKWASWLMEEDAREQVAEMRRLWVFLVRHRFQQLWIIVLKIWWQTFSETFAVLAFTTCGTSAIYFLFYVSLYSYKLQLHIIESQTLSISLGSPGSSSSFFFTDKYRCVHATLNTTRLKLHVQINANREQRSCIDIIWW